MLPVVGASLTYFKMELCTYVGVHACGMLTQGGYKHAVLGVSSQLFNTKVKEV